MEIKLPTKLESETHDEHLIRCQEVLFDGIRKAGYNPESMYPTAIVGIETAIGGMETVGDTVTFNVTMSCERWQ